MNEKYNILVVDDEKDILEIISYVVSSAQIQIFSALDPDEADILLQQHKINLVISDEIFPKDRGQPWINRLKQSYDHMQYIIFSGQLDLVDQCSGPQCRYIYKPDFYQLQEAIKAAHQEWLDQKLMHYSKEAK